MRSTEADNASLSRAPRRYAHILVGLFGFEPKPNRLRGEYASRNTSGPIWYARTESNRDRPLIGRMLSPLSYTRIMVSR